MRKLIVMGVAVLFVVYCVLATQRQNLYSVPQSRVVTVDIIEGATLEHFLSDAYGSKRHERVASLERRHLHPIKPQPIPAEKGTAPVRIVQPDQQLLGKDFEALARAGQTRIEVRDPADLLAFARRKLELRQDLKAPDGTVIAPQGAHVNKAVLEAATEKGITEISVVGSGDVVGINGTMPMVILIFVAMVTVLKSILWEPLCALVDRRNEELRAGLHFQRTHRAQAEKLEAERLRRYGEVRRAGHEVVAAARHDGMLEADKIMTAAREEAFRIRQKTEEEIVAGVRRAETELAKEIPQFARSIRNAILGIQS